jgi:hypothetical protein
MSARRAAAIAILVGAGAGTAAVAHAAPRGGYVVIPPTGPATPHAPISNIIFLNRCAGGCTFTQGNASDARTNLTILGTGPVGTPYALPEFPYGDAVWNEIVACVREIYAPYDAVVTDVDPGPQVLHHEGVVPGGLADAIGQDPAVYGGIAPLWGDCRLLENTVSFTFANAFSPDPTSICAVVAQETGHAFGLEHSFNCADPMTYLPACGLQFFRDGLEPCGEFAERPCMCGGFSQNVHGRLDALFGPNPAPLPAPAVTITVPLDGASVAAGFSVEVDAIDRRGLHRVELWLNGWLWTTTPAMRGQTRFVFPEPAGVPGGVIDVEIRAYNDLQSAIGTRRITVTKGAPCASADTCAAGQRCDGGRCLWDPAVGELGDRCDYPQYCTSGICEAGECAEPCIAAGTGGCPSGYECVAEDGTTDGLCLATAAGCCSAAGGGLGGLAAQAGLAGLVLGVTLSRRRRRR